MPGKKLDSSPKKKSAGSGRPIGSTLWPEKKIPCSFKFTPKAIAWIKLHNYKIEEAAHQAKLSFIRTVKGLDGW